MKDPVDERVVEVFKKVFTAEEIPSLLYFEASLCLNPIADLSELEEFPLTEPLSPMKIVREPDCMLFSTLSELPLLFQGEKCLQVGVSARERFRRVERHFEISKIAIKNLPIPTVSVRA
jgi:hypothetical protein